MKIIATATGVQQQIDGGEFFMMDYLFDVILQEVRCEFRVIADRYWFHDKQCVKGTNDLCFLF